MTYGPDQLGIDHNCKSMCGAVLSRSWSCVPKTRTHTLAPIRDKQHKAVVVSSAAILRAAYIIIRSSNEPQTGFLCGHARHIVRGTYYIWYALLVERRRHVGSYDVIVVVVVAGCLIGAFNFHCERVFTH